MTTPTPPARVSPVVLVADCCPGQDADPAAVLADAFDAYVVGAVDAPGAEAWLARVRPNAALI